MGADPLTIGLLVAAGASTAASIQQQRQAIKQQRRAAAVARRRERIASRRTIIQNIEDFRQVQGTAINVAAQTGGLEASGVQNLQSSLLSQLASNLTFQQQLDLFARMQASHLNKAAQFQSNAQGFASIASLASSFAKFNASNKG